MLQHDWRRMAVDVNGIRYLSATEIAKQIGVSRQTLWRWRNDGKIPLGRRYRDRQILFTEDELQQILAFANRVESLTPSGPKQLRLF
jgi:excisionase family DNA binding protein